MRNSYPAKILKVKGPQALIQFKEPLERRVLDRSKGRIEVRIDDGRSLSSEQRKKIFAIIRDISLWSGHEPEFIRRYLTWDFCSNKGYEWFSLSDVSMTVAKEFISFLIDFCFYWSVPTMDSLLNETDDISQYLYSCLEHRKCAICNKRAQVHHVDRIGMGRDREKIVHLGLNAIALCGKHHTEAHLDEKAFFEKHHVYGIKLDAYLCECLKLNTKRRR